MTPIKSFALVLLYYDNALLLKKWLRRLYFHSDYIKFVDKATIIVADSGTPYDKISDTQDAIEDFKLHDLNEEDYEKVCILYARADTDAIRKTVSSHIDARPACHAYNMACLDISKSDLIYTSVIGQIFTPKYFEQTLLLHLQDEKAVVLPKRFDLDCNDYHENYYNKDFSELKKFKFLPSGGWPDMSVRRKWIQEVGGWDENYITIAPVDMDLASRLCGKLDDGTESNRIFPQKSKFNNLGLNFYQPFVEDKILSLTCNTYKGHIHTNDSRRQLGYEIGLKYYLENWGKIKRNENRIPLKYIIKEL